MHIARQGKATIKQIMKQIYIYIYITTIYSAYLWAIFSSRLRGSPGCPLWGSVGVRSKPPRSEDAAAPQTTTAETRFTGSTGSTGSGGMLEAANKEHIGVVLELNVYRHIWQSHGVSGHKQSTAKSNLGFYVNVACGRPVAGTWSTRTGAEKISFVQL